MRPSLQEKKPQPFDWGKHLENLPDRNVANHLATLRNKSASSLFQRHAVALRLELIVQAQANGMECRIKVVGMKTQRTQAYRGDARCPDRCTDIPPSRTNLD